MIGSQTLELKLRLAGKQKQLLDELFEGPCLLQRLLAMADVPVVTEHDAAKFLNRNWTRLVPYMFKHGGGRSPKAMEAFILSIAGGSLKRFCIDFSSHCSITKDQEIRFPIPELGAAAVVDATLLKAARSGMRHLGGFGLVSAGNDYYVAIDFLGIAPPEFQGISPNPAQASRSNLRKTLPKTKGVSASDFLAYFNSRVMDHLREQLALSKGYSTTRFEELSGRSVSGGLPSLPRRR